MQVLSGQEESCLSREQKGNVLTKMVGVCLSVTHSEESVGMCDGMG